MIGIDHVANMVRSIDSLRDIEIESNKLKKKIAKLKGEEE